MKLQDSSFGFIRKSKVCPNCGELMFNEYETNNWICTHCSHVEVITDSDIYYNPVYCRKCGKHISNMADSHINGFWVCPECGNKDLFDENRYNTCIACGRRFWGPGNRGYCDACFEERYGLIVETENGLEYYDDYSFSDLDIEDTDECDSDDYIYDEELDDDYYDNSSDDDYYCDNDYDSSYDNSYDDDDDYYNNSYDDNNEDDFTGYNWGTDDSSGDYSSYDDDYDNGYDDGYNDDYM